jgi:hypothetical protein
MIVQTLIAGLKSSGLNVAATATTGIASLLLHEGSTLHSKLAIPLQIDEGTEPFTDYTSFRAEVLRRMDVLIIDEISVAHKHLIAYVDREFRAIDRRTSHLPFGGKVIITKKIAIFIS